MNKHIFDDVEQENIEIAHLIADNSSKILLKKPQYTFDEILNHSHKKRKHYKCVITAGAAVVCCFAITFIVFQNRQNISVPQQPTFSSMIRTAQSIENSPHMAASYQEVYEKLKDIPSVYNAGNGLYDDFASSGTDTAKAEEKEDSAVSSDAKVFSDTNEQTKGVHEADIVKTDGNYIYTLTPIANKQNVTTHYRVYISKADGTKVTHISQLQFKIDKSNKNKEISDYCNEMYYHDNKLIILCSRTISTRQYNNELADNYNPYYMDEYRTFIYTYDVTDRSNPTLISKNNQEGRYISSRMIDNYLYTITSKQIEQLNYDDFIPMVNGEKISCDCIYMPETIDSRGFSIITALDVNDSSDYRTSVSVAGNSDFIYAGTENIYILNNYTDIKDKTKSKSSENETAANSRLTKVKDKDILNEIKEIHPKTDTSQVFRKKEHYSREYIETLNIIKFHFDKGNIHYKAQNKVPGYAKDNLFFDEKSGYLRFVCTVNSSVEKGIKNCYYDRKGKLIYENYIPHTTKDNDISTTLFVLTPDLEISAKIGGLAKGETLYSARYLGDFGYFVTFEQIDPLFSVDFSDMEHPKIIGSLKIPGNSNYLHFYSDNLLFGFGSETEDEQLKLEMFNIKKGSAKQKSKLVLKDFNDSDALYDYKAIMVDPRKNLIGFSAFAYTFSDEFFERNYYLLYTYKNNEFKEIARIFLGGDLDFDSCVRGFYIDNYFYVVDINSGIYSINLNTYQKNKKIKHISFQK